MLCYAFFDVRHRCVIVIVIPIDMSIFSDAAPLRYCDCTMRALDFLVKVFRCNDFKTAIRCSVVQIVNDMCCYLIAIQNYKNLEYISFRYLIYF